MDDLDCLVNMAEKVSTMRRLQQTYFQTRSPEVLRNCKRLEVEVDELCREVLQGGPRQRGFNFDTHR